MSTSIQEKDPTPPSNLPSAPSGDELSSLTLWQCVRLSLQGRRFDYTSVPLKRALLLLAVPTVLEMSMQSLFAVVHVFWVSRQGGADAVAVVGLTESVMLLIYAIAAGISYAATAIVARRIGEKDPERAAQAAGQIIVLGVGLCGCMGMVMSSFAPHILRLMGASPSVVELGTDFARIMLGSSITAFMVFLINAIFRGAGDAVFSMRTLWLANGLNMVFGPCFIFGLGPFPEMGVTGAAIATNIGRGIGVLYQLWHLTGINSRMRVRLRHLKPSLRDLRDILTTASTGIAQSAIATTSWVVLFKILAIFGSAALAGYTIAVRLVTFSFLPALGLAYAAAILVGQNLGAGKPERAQQAVWIAARLNVLCLGVVGLLFVIFAGPLVGLFTNDAAVIDQGSRALRIVSLAFPFSAAGMCLLAAFNGAGDTRTPTWVNLFCLWLGQVPLAWVLAEIFRLGSLGVFIAVPVSWSAQVLCATVLFRRGHWKHQRV